MLGDGQSVLTTTLLRVHPAVADRPDHGVRPCRGAQLVANGGHVVGHGALADAQAMAYLRIAVTGGQEAQHLDFPGSQAAVEP